MKLDVLIVAAHPDDAEICVGGTILKLMRAGKRVGIVDATRGEMGTRGTADDRAREVAAANALMKINARHNLDLGDGRVEVTLSARERLATGRSTPPRFDPDRGAGHSRWLAGARPPVRDPPTRLPSSISFGVPERTARFIPA